jgi:hypothetical protein
MSKFYQNYSVTSSDIVTICISMQSHNISSDPVLLKKQINRISIKKSSISFHFISFHFIIIFVYLFFQQDRIGRDVMWLHGNTNGDNIGRSYWIILSFTIYAPQAMCIFLIKKIALVFYTVSQKDPVSTRYLWLQ